MVGIVKAYHRADFTDASVCLQQQACGGLQPAAVEIGNGGGPEGSRKLPNDPELTDAVDFFESVQRIGGGTEIMKVLADGEEIGINGGSLSGLMLCELQQQNGKKLSQSHGLPQRIIESGFK